MILKGLTFFSRKANFDLHSSKCFSATKGDKLGSVNRANTVYIQCNVRVRWSLDLWVHVVLLDVNEVGPELWRRHNHKRSTLGALHVHFKKEEKQENSCKKTREEKLEIQFLVIDTTNLQRKVEILTVRESRVLRRKWGISKLSILWSSEGECRYGRNSP